MLTNKELQALSAAAEVTIFPGSDALCWEETFVGVVTLTRYTKTPAGIVASFDSVECVINAPADMGAKVCGDSDEWQDFARQLVEGDSITFTFQEVRIAGSILEVLTGHVTRQGVRVGHGKVLARWEHPATGPRMFYSR